MKFHVAGSKVICSRLDNTVEDEDVYRQVVAFDANVDRVPPHVAAKLTRGETEKLERFLADRRRIDANSSEVNMLEALPDLIAEATDTLESVDRLNESMYTALRASMSRFASALEAVRPNEDGRSTPVEQMRKSEALKARLTNIKDSL